MEEPVWIALQTVVAIQGMQLSEHGGLPGIRDLGLLESALARPRQIYADQPDLDLQKLAAAYMVGIIRNHPFLDGDKRTGLVVGALFLRRNGGKFRAPQPEAANVILEVAAGAWSEEQLAGWLARWSE